MRSLIISIIPLSLLIVCWIFFYNYTDQNLNSIIEDFDNVVMQSIEDEDWDKAYNKFDSLYDDWHKYRKNAFFFLDTSEINEADYAFARTLKYIEAKDVSNSSGELLSLKEQLKFLHENERITLQNIL